MYEVSAIAVSAVVTLLIRLVPFILFGKKEELPWFLIRISEVLPQAIMVLLVIYCLKNTSFASPSYGIPEIIASLLVVLLYQWKKNMLVAIFVPTVCYMLLVQLF